MTTSELLIVARQPKGRRNQRRIGNGVEDGTQQYLFEGEDRDKGSRVSGSSDRRGRANPFSQMGTQARVLQRGGRKKGLELGGRTLLIGIDKKVNITGRLFLHRSVSDKKYHQYSKTERNANGGRLVTAGDAAQRREGSEQKKVFKSKGPKGQIGSIKEGEVKSNSQGRRRENALF